MSRSRSARAARSCASARSCRVSSRLTPRRCRPRIETVTNSTTSTTAIATTITTTPVATAAIGTSKASLMFLRVLRSQEYPDAARREPMETNRQLASPTWWVVIGRYVVGCEARMAGREAFGGVLLRQPGHSPRRRADLLRADVTVSDAAAGGLAPGPTGRVSGHLQRDHPARAPRCADGHPGAARRRGARGAEEQGHRCRRPRYRNPDRSVRGYWLPRAGAARPQRRVRSVPRTQLRAPQADRHRFDVRSDGPSPHHAGADVRGWGRRARRARR